MQTLVGFHTACIKCAVDIESQAVYLIYAMMLWQRDDGHRCRVSVSV